MGPRRTLALTVSTSSIEYKPTEIWQSYVARSRASQPEVLHEPLCLFRASSTSYALYVRGRCRSGIKDCDVSIRVLSVEL